ncbi:hypothetical protein LINGRAHAP2_LOCUS24245, partial [Linum grandiflorum]
YDEKCIHIPSTSTFTIHFHSFSLYISTINSQNSPPRLPPHRLGFCSSLSRRLR